MFQGPYLSHKAQQYPKRINNNLYRVENYQFQIQNITQNRRDNGLLQVKGQRCLANITIPSWVPSEAKSLLHRNRVHLYRI